MNKYSLTTLAVIFSIVGLYSPKSNSEDFYEVIDLGTFEEGSDGVFAFDINDDQTIVGYSTIDPITGFSRGFSFNEGDASLNDLGAIDNSEVFVEITNVVDGEELTETVNVGVETEASSLIFGVNNNDLAVGLSFRVFGSVSSQEVDGVVSEEAIGTTFERAVYINTSTLQISEIPDFVENNPRNMRALNINNNYIVGIGDFDDPDDVDPTGDEIEGTVQVGFIYETESGSLLKVKPELGNDYPNLSLRSINDNGYAIGVTALRAIDIFGRTIVLSDAIGVDLNDVNNVTTFNIFEGSKDSLWDINNSGVAVGSANKIDDGVIKAITIDINTSEIEELGTLNSNFQYSEAFNINDMNQIVGISQTKSQPDVYSGFIYENGEMKDLSKMIGCDTGWTIHEARSINNNGFITGTGVLNGKARAFMLKPIPNQTAPVCEDDSLNLEGSGSTGIFSLFSLIGLFGLRRRYLRK